MSRHKPHAARAAGLPIRLGHDYGLVPVLRREIRFAPEPRSYDAALAALERAGLPVVDHICGTLPVAAEAVEPGYRELAAIKPQHAPWRNNEYALFASGAVAEWCSALGIVPIGYREIQRLWRSHSS